MAGAPIGFFVEGPNPRPVSPTTLDGAGQATYCYQGDQPGLDQVIVFHDFDRDAVFDEGGSAERGPRYWDARPDVGVSIDVMPGSARNPILLRRTGVVPVALLSTATFDALSVDAASLCFGAAPPDPARSDCTSDASRQFGSDVDADGDQDLVVHFHVVETGLRPGDVQACLAGLTLAGTAIVGCDAVEAR